MELKELTEKTMELFGVHDPSELGTMLLSACSNQDKLSAFSDMVGDLDIDWLQKIYQYYLADRKEKKQDYTPATLAELMGVLVGDADRIVDMCAGSGALIIQKWAKNHNTEFTAIEFDANVIPFLLFNMVLRNISCKVYHADALTDEWICAWYVEKGERFGHIIDIKSTV